MPLNADLRKADRAPTPVELAFTGEQAIPNYLKRCQFSRRTRKLKNFKCVCGGEWGQGSGLVWILMGGKGRFVLFVYLSV